MGRCGCSGDSCACSLVAGQRVTITGTGSAQNPLRISADPVRIITSDTDTIAFTTTGEGTIESPYSISADFIGSTEPPDWTPAESRTWSGSVSLTDISSPRTVRVALTGNVTAIALPTWGSSDSGSIVLVLTQDAVGGRTVDLSGITWESGSQPVLSSAASARDVLRLFWTGLSWVGEPLAFNVS